MGFLGAIKSGFGNYANFNGRACRSEFWWWFLFAIIIGCLGLIPILGWLISLAMLLPNLSMQVRRLHDTNHSGWYWFLNLIPLIGSIILLVFYLKKGTDGDNQFGSDPLA